MEPLGMLIDFTECIGCGECVKACQKQNNLPGEYLETDMSFSNYTVVLKKDETYYRKLCMHCLEPVCESVCPVGALTKTKQGACAVRSGQVPGLPVLHDGLSVRSAAL